MNPSLATDAQRRAYAITRLHKAMGRLIDADEPEERLSATRWVTAWSGAIGERRIAQLVAERSSSELSS